MVDRHLIDVHALLLRADEVLLTQRKGGAWDGMWHLPSGKLDAGEPATTAAAREVEEETGVRVDLACAHTLHVNGSGPEPRLGIFFPTRRWTGEPANREPDKCSGLHWFPQSDLPQNTIACPAQGLRAVRDGIPCSEMGWHPAR